MLYPYPCLSIHSTLCDIHDSSQMFKISTDTLAQFLMALWTTCGRLNHRPLEWNKGRLVPLYKRGDPAIPSNHCPICLLSATRKIIERAITSTMNESFTPHRSQMGFQKHMGTEMTLAQMHRASNQRQNWIAILDLKSAYDRVCRATLMKRYDDALPEGLANMVSHIIQELEVHTLGDETGTNAKINRGVTQGGPASPTLFNVFIDTLAIQLCASVGKIERTPVRLYADDVILLADSLWELVLALRICSKWARENSMGWSKDAAKIHILLRSSRSKHFKWLPFAIGRIQTTTKAKYPGVQVTTRAIIPGLHIKKYQAGTPNHNATT